MHASILKLFVSDEWELFIEIIIVQGISEIIIWNNVSCFETCIETCIVSNIICFKKVWTKDEY